MCAHIYFIKMARNWKTFLIAKFNELQPLLLEKDKVHYTEAAALWKVSPNTARYWLQMLAKMDFNGLTGVIKYENGYVRLLIDEESRRTWLENLKKEEKEEEEEKKEEEEEKEEKKEEIVEEKIKAIDYATDKQKKAIKNWIKYIADELNFDVQIVKEVIEEMAKVKIDNFMTKEEANEVIQAIKKFAEQKGIKLPGLEKSKRGK